MNEYQKVQFFSQVLFVQQHLGLPLFLPQQQLQQQQQQLPLPSSHVQPSYQLCYHQSDVESELQEQPELLQVDTSEQHDLLKLMNDTQVLQFFKDYVNENVEDEETHSDAITRVTTPVNIEGKEKEQNIEDDILPTGTFNGNIGWEISTATPGLDSFHLFPQLELTTNPKKQCFTPTSSAPPTSTTAQRSQEDQDLMPLGLSLDIEDLLSSFERQQQQIVQLPVDNHPIRTESSPQIPVPVSRSITKTTTMEKTIVAPSGRKNIQQASSSSTRNITRSPKPKETVVYTESKFIDFNPTSVTVPSRSTTATTTTPTSTTRKNNKCTLPPSSHTNNNNYGRTLNFTNTSTPQVRSAATKEEAVDSSRKRPRSGEMIDYFRDVSERKKRRQCVTTIDDNQGNKRKIYSYNWTNKAFY